MNTCSTHAVDKPLRCDVEANGSETLKSVLACPFRSSRSPLEGRNPLLHLTLHESDRDDHLLPTEKTLCVTNRTPGEQPQPHLRILDKKCVL
jgi:hypothetical protein